MRRRRTQLLLLSLLLGTPAVYAAIRHARDVEAVALLRRVATAASRTSYRGASSWSGPRRSEANARKTKEHAGESARAGTETKGFGKNGFSWMGRGPSKRVTVRHDGESGRTAYWFAGPFHREFVLTSPSHRMPDPAAWCVDVDALLENYRSRELEPREFLGRKVKVLRVVPRHAGRPTLEIWFDALSDLALKVSTFRPDGSLYRVSRFDRIEYGPEAVEAVDLRHAHRYAGTPVSLEDPQAAAGFVPLFPDYLPAGFRLVEARVKQCATPQLTLVYSDGVTAFDLRQWPRATPAVLEDYYARGPWGRKSGDWNRSEGIAAPGHPDSDAPRAGSSLSGEWGQGKRDSGKRSHSKWGSGKPGPGSWVKMWMHWHLHRCRERLLRTGDGEAATVLCEEQGFHNSWDLRVGDLEITLMARGDLDRAEMLKVLRSLDR